MKERMRRVLVKLLFVVALIVFVFSWGWMDGIGVEGLLQYAAFMVSGSYVILFIYSNT